MKTLFKVLLLIIIWGLITTAAIFGALLLGYSLENGVILAFVLFAAWLTLRLGKKLIIRLQARARAKRLLKEAGAAGDEQSITTDTNALDARFKDVLSFLRNSPLQDRRLHPNYALPWFLLLSNASLASNWIKAAKVTLPTDAENRFTGPESEVTFWPYNESLIMQLPRNLYNKEGNHAPEGRRLLQLLVANRQEEPINGLVLPIDWQELENQSEEELYEQGIKLRDLLGQLVKQLKTQFPVYLVITGLDQLKGTHSWATYLPQHLKEQAFGCLNVQKADAESFVEESIQKLAERLKDLNIFVLRGGKVDPDALVLPSRLGELSTRLRNFTRGIFQESVFEELPNLRGFYLAGSLNNGASTEGIFCHDLLTRVLPNERTHVTRLPAAVRAERAVRNLWISGYALICLLLVGSLGLIYRQDVLFLDDISQRYAGNLVEQSDFASNIKVNQQFSTLIEQLENRSFLPWINDVTATPDFMQRLQRIFVQRVEQNLMLLLDRRLQLSAEQKLFESNLSGNELGQEMARFVSQLVREINLLQAYIDGASLDSLAAMPPAYSQQDDASLAALNMSQLTTLNRLHLLHLVWNENPERMEARLKSKRVYLQRILAQSPGSIDWLIDWGNLSAGEHEVRLGEYWRGIRASNNVRVPAAFTVAGKTKIDDFIEQLLETQDIADQVNTLIPGFAENYRARYLDAWKQFALAFQNGVDVLEGPNSWREAIDLQATSRNQHFLVLDRMASELKPFMDENSPEWVYMLELYADMNALAPNETDTGALKKITLKILKRAGKVGKMAAKAGKKVGTGEAIKDEQALMVERAAKLLAEYRANIRELTKESQIKSIAHLSMQDLYNNPDDPAKGQTALATGYRQLQDIQGLLGRNTNFNEPFWAVFRGPLNMFRRFLVQESSNQLQTVWEEKFLAASEGVPEDRMAGFLYSEGGLLWSFFDEQLSPFVQRRFGAGYASRSAFGVPYPVNRELLGFLSKADEYRKQNRDNYSVILNTRPITVNSGAKKLPSRTLLEMQCENGLQELENLNYRQAAEFNWSLNCTHVRLTIQVDNYQLVKNYSGHYGFPRFLEEFAQGSRRFNRSEFPLYEERLAEWNIQYFDIQFGLRGHTKVIDVLTASRQRLPRHIVRGDLL
ncbi:type VI secretion protein IcmF/TssM N-terminal domain-containing protein [Marinospirillum minutulum]|uniref:type VI secretion protein IcmF/TssM N-terminal domain-containing protein n=1 Tax=Marinospirillum minutulum TaxID=64974 RepID=UPI000405D6E6|nr:type VI secretion protein IcmF/TssM N-terminal domain-containing protein [Marinospirillum minutulum]